MGQKGSEFEIKNSEGITTSEEGTTSSSVGSVTSVPPTPDKLIETILLENDSEIIDGTVDNELLFSLDSGTTWKKLYAGRFFQFEPKGVKQVLLKSNVANCPYRISLTYEQFTEDN